MSTKSAIVEPGMEPQVETLDDSDATFSNLIVNYLPLSFRERHIRKLFSTFGKIESCRVMRFAQDGRTLSKGYGFVDFSTRAEAEAAIQGLNGKNVLGTGKNLKVGFAKPSGQRVKSNLFVTHIPSRWSESDLDEAFGVHGKIIERRILRDQDGGSRRSAFVRFDNSDQARKAIEKMNMWRPNMVDQPILVRVATEHESKRSKGPYNANKANKNSRNRRKKTPNVSKRHEDFAAPKRPTSVPMRNQVQPQRRAQAAPANKAPVMRRDHIDMASRSSMPEYRNERRNYYGQRQKPYQPHTQNNMQARSPQAAPERRLENWRGIPSSRYDFDNDFAYLNYDNMGFDMMAPAPQIRADIEAIRDPDVGWEGIYRDPSFLSEDYNPNYGPDPYYPPRHSIPERGLAERNIERSVPKPPAPPAQQPGRTSGTEVHLVNFPLCLDKAAIMNMSRAYGEVSDVRIAIDNNGRSIRLATLCFTTVEAADRAIAAFDGCTIAGCVVHCSKANLV
jgi:RNA recognition motif-containing protein